MDNIQDMCGTCDAMDQSVPCIHLFFFKFLDFIVVPFKINFDYCEIS